MPGSGLGGLAEGLWGYVDHERQLSQERENTAAQKEAQLYSLLAEHGTEEFASMGLAGLAEMANPKRKAKGMRGFFGEMEASQTLPRIRELMATPQQRAVTTPGLPSKGIPADIAMRGVPQPPPSGAGLGGVVQPPPAPMQAGGLPEVLPQSQLGRGGPPPAPGDAFREMRGTPDVGRVDQVEGPRQVLMRPEDRISRDTKARERAEVEGEVEGYVAAGMDRTQALELVKQSRIRRGVGAAGMSVREGNVHQDPSGQWVQDLYDASGRVVSTIPALDPRETRPGAPNYSTAMNDTAGRLFGKPYGSLSAEEKQTTYDTWRKDNPEAVGEVATARTTAKAEAEAKAPLSTNQRTLERGRLYDEWTKASAPLKTIQEQNAALKAGMVSARRGDLAAGAEAVRVTFSKILDPNSVVMPGEFLRGNAALSLAAWAKGKIEQYQKGGIAIPLAELETYATLAEEIEKSYGTFLEGERKRVETAATEAGVDVAGIFGSAQTPSQKAAAATGGAPSPASAKVATLDEARAWAAAKGWTEQQAIADLQRRGYSIATPQQ